MPDRLVISGGRDFLGRPFKEFVVGREHTKFEWISIWVGRNPNEFLGTDLRTATTKCRDLRLLLIGASGSNVPRALTPRGEITPICVSQDERFLRFRRPLRDIIRLAPTGSLEWDDPAVYRLGNVIYRRSMSWAPISWVYLDDKPDVLDDTVCLYGAGPVIETAREIGEYSEYIDQTMTAVAVAAPPATNTGRTRRTPATDTVRQYIAQNYPSGIPHWVTDKHIARATRVGVSTVRRARKKS